MVAAHIPGPQRAMDRTVCTPPRPQKLEAVQALRGLAAFLVLLYHAAAVQKFEVAKDNSVEMGYLTGFWDQGFAGVDMFFVISGFIMVYVTQNYQRSLRNWSGFLYARITRIYPIWWIFAGIMALYFLIVYGQPASPERIADDQVVSHLLKSFLLLPQNTHPVLGVGWTLIHEMFFYLMFAAMLLPSAKWRPAIMAVWAAIIIASAFTIGSPRYSTNFLELLISPLALEFLAGAVIGYLVIKSVRIPGGAVAGLSALALIIALVIGINVMSPHLTWHRVLVYTLPCAGLLWGLVLMERAGELSIPKWISAIGDASYSLYLSHMFVLLGLRMVWQRANPYLPPDLQFVGPGFIDNILFALLGIVGSIIFSLIVYRLIEKPMLKLARRYRPL